MKLDLRNFDLEDLKGMIVSLAQPPHRAGQIFRWLYQKNAEDISEMTDLPKELILTLKQEYHIGLLSCDERLKSRDGTEKYLWKLEDSERVESVLIRGGIANSRVTLCVSTQVGCKFKCPFCASGERGFFRDLSVSEILGQVIASQKAAGERITNIVFMGMGEPLDNYDNLIKAIRVMNDPAGLGIGARKITISTCGVVPAINKLKELGLQVELSVSLHAVEDALRDRLVPVNKKYPLKELEKALAEYFKDTGRVVTLEYTLIAGVNDRREDALALAAFAKRVRAKVNLIACNARPDSLFGKLKQGRLEEFKVILTEKGVTATIRQSKGDDIMAACGQLAAKKYAKTTGSEVRAQKTGHREQ
jgi:23S rRNA (adenine2503-C2)-methyltransferase